MSKPVAIVTGAASGIGLALTKDLLNQGYRVAMADVNKAEGIRLSAELGEDTLFVPTNIAIYAEQSALFARAFEWGGNRLDFFAANAGIDDRQIIYEKDEKTDENGIPLEFNLTTLRVNFDSAVQGVWLFKFFARKNKVPGGKVVITSSTAGLYPMTPMPIYTASKHALVGLTRSLGPQFIKENITVNCICPAFVPTNLCPPHMLAKFPKEHITPMTTVLKAFNTFLADNTMTGEIVEVSLGHLFFRQVPEYPNESQRWIGEEAKEFWAQAYEEAPPAKNGV